MKTVYWKNNMGDSGIVDATMDHWELSFLTRRVYHFLDWNTFLQDYKRFWRDFDATTIVGDELWMTKENGLVIYHTKDDEDC